MVSPAAALPDRWLADWERSERMPFYTRANAGEVLPDPASPLGWTLVFEKGLLPGWLRGLVEFGIYREGELPMERPPVAGLFGGYFYINLSHCRVVAIRMGMTVEAFDAALLGNAAAAPPYRPHPDDLCQECSAKVAQTIGEILAASEFPQIDADLERVLAKRRGRPDLAALPEAGLVAQARSFLPELDNAFARHDYSTFGSAVGPATLAQACAGAGEPEALLDLISGFLVAPITDAAWTPLFLLAGAVVVDVGALNSHAVVVSRELGIPCVLSLEDATMRLRDDMVLAVDGTAGTVTVVSA